MGRRQHEALETDALLARKDEQISALDARLHQTITHLSLVRARLLSTLDQLDALQQEHTAALATAAREQQRLEVKVRAAEEMARAGEADRMDMRDAVAMLVKRVEATPDFRNWPRSQTQLSSLSEPSQHSLTHQQALVSPPASPSKPHRHKHSLSSSTNTEAGRASSTVEQLAYASTLISHFRSERDTALLRTEQSETRVLELEARLARREAALAACSCAASGAGTTGTGTSGAAHTYSKRDERGASWMRTADDLFLSRRRGRDEQEQDLLDVDADADGGMADILDVSLDRNRELEREVHALSRRLDSVRVAPDSRSPMRTNTNLRHSSTYNERREHEQQALEESQVHSDHSRVSPRVCTPPPRHHRLHHHNENQHSPHRRHDGDASLLSSLSFSPSSTATSGETGEATPRQYAYEYHDRHDAPLYAQPGGSGGPSDDESAYGDVFGDMGGDESVTQPVELHDGKPIRHLHHGLDDVLSGGDVRECEGDAITKSVHIPIPSLHALHRQIALLGEKIDAFAAERRRTAVAAREAQIDDARLVRVEVGEPDVYDDDDEQRRLSSIPESEGDGWSTDDEMGDRIRDEVEDAEEGEGGAGGTDNSALEQHVETGGGAWPARRGADANSIAQHDYADHEDGERSSDGAPEYTRPPTLSPLPLPLPLTLSLPSPLPLPQAQSPPSPSHSHPPRRGADEPGPVYDHPHETCEATLLAARKRETHLTDRVRVLEGALSVVEAQVRRQGVPDRAAVQAPSARNETGTWLVDVAVQTLLVVPPTSLTTLAPVGNLAGFDVSNLHVAEEAPRIGVEEGDRDTEQGEDADDWEIPMELATPLWPVGALPVVPDVHAGARTEDDLDASAGVREPEDSECAHESESDADVGLPPEGQRTGGCDGEEPVFPDEDERPPDLDETSLLAESNQPLAEVDAESSMNPPLLDLATLVPSATQGRPSTPPPSTRRSTSPPAQPTTPSPPSSTGTSPTLAVGLLPPLPPHAHLSLPASLLHHSHHGSSSLSSPLLPVLGPHAHAGLRRAHTDSDVSAAGHGHQSESTHRFVMYRATSSFVAELRQAESRLAEMEVRGEEHSAVGGSGDLAASDVHDAESGMTREKDPSDGDEDLPLQTLY